MTRPGLTAGALDPSIVSLNTNRSSSSPKCLCVFITAGPSTKLFACVWGGYWRTCATRDDEPRPVWTCVCLLLQDLVQRTCVCSLLQDLGCLQGGGGGMEDMCYEVCVFITAVPITKLFARGGAGNGGHVLRETTSRGRCELVCPSRTSERGVREGYCVREGEGEEGERDLARGSVQGRCDYTTALDIEVDP